MEKQKPWWVLVGGRHRLGRALAEGLAPEHNLVLTSSSPWPKNDAWKEELSARTEVRTLCWNALDPDSGSQMMAEMANLRAEGIRFHSAVVVAGTFPEQPFGAWDDAALMETLRVNLAFPLLAAQAIAPALEEGGSLQFILDAALHRPMTRRLPYTAAKAGLAAMVPGLAKRLAPRVRVAGHALGVALPDADSDPEALAGLNLLKRNGSPEDLLRALRFVAESPYLTGEILTLDGGRRWA